MEHLQTTTSQRGFDSMPPIEAACGGQVEAHESSSAEGPHIWLRAETRADMSRVEGPTVRVALHLDAEGAWRLGEQLQHLVRNHYQGDATPDYAGRAGSADAAEGGGLVLMPGPGGTSGLIEADSIRALVGYVEQRDGATPAEPARVCLGRDPAADYDPECDGPIEWAAVYRSSRDGRLLDYSVGCHRHATAQANRAALVGSIADVSVERLADVEQRDGTSPPAGTGDPVKDGAIAALRAQAFPVPTGDTTCRHTGCTDHQVTRAVVHCFAGPSGADWDLEQAVEEVRRAARVVWVDGFAGHDLAVECADGKVRNFDVVRQPGQRRESGGE